MTYLAIDTSTDTAGLAIVTNGQLTGEDTWHCTRNQSVELLPHLVTLLTSTKAGVKDITGIIIACGPGGFNSLRVGFGTAKGLAFGLDIPIIGVSTLAAAAYCHATTGLPVCAVLPAGRAEVAWSVFQELDGTWQNTSSEVISAPSDIYPHINSATVLAGEPGETIIQELRANLGDLIIIPGSPPKSRVRALAELGTKYLVAGRRNDVATLQPVYLRRPPITQPKSKSAGMRPSPPPAI